MLFSSLIFLCGFLPIIIIGYYTLPKQWKNVFLLFTSILFYSWGGISYTLVLILSILFNYIIALRINATNSIHWLRIGLLINIGLLFTFKYLDFFILNLNKLLNIVSDTTPLPYSNFVLPIGISFFTFQQMSLLWDIYRNPSYQKVSFLNTALYISFFPQLIAGPIVRYDDIINQIKNRTETLKLFSSGIHRFILGLFKKVIIANQLAFLADNIFTQSHDLLTTSSAWLAIIAYSLQIYFDFSGYSDMAIGLGRMFGFSILENFNFPYTSKSIQEFWRRWHISLSTWFRDYVYIPLGGNRISPQKTYINLIFVFLCTGFWHGATWSFIFWGGFHGLFLILERIGLNKILKRLPSFLSWFYTIFVVMMGWVFFRIESFSEALSFIKLLFSCSSDAPLFAIKFLDRESVIIIMLAILSSSRIFEHIKNNYFTKQSELTLSIFKGFRNVISILVLLYVITILNAESYNPFIYFRF